MPPTIPKTFLTVLIAVGIFAGLSVRADEPANIHLPQPETFDRLAARLAELKSEPFAAAAKNEFQKTEQLVSRGRLSAAAGRLMQAGYTANQAERTLVLISLQMKIAALKQTEKETSAETTRLRRELSELKAVLQELSQAADAPPSVSPLEDKDPQDSPSGDSP